MDYKKPQSTIVQGGVGLYPLTTADQVILADGSRLEKDGKISADSAADSAKLGGKAPEYYLQPRNLLDNSDFRNPVNQRGKTNYTGGGYTIDRWLLGVSSVVANVLDDGIEITGGDSTYNAPYIQKVPENLTGKTVTLAVCDSDGVIETVTGTVQTDSACSTNTTYGSITFYHASSDGTLWAQINVKYGGSKIFRWAALYEGNYTADTLPPYVPKGYASELAECQRYFRKGAQAVTIGTQFSSGSLFSLSVPGMRIRPTTTLTDIQSQGWGNVVASNYTAGWTGNLGSSFFVNYIGSISDDVGKNVVVVYEMSADL